MTKARDLANGGFGLVLVKPSSVVGGTDNGKGTVSFSAATSISLNDVFSATYQNYSIVLEFSCGTTGTGVQIKFRVGGSDASTNYNWQFLTVDGTSVSSNRTTSGTGGIEIAITGTAAQNMTAVTVCNPFLVATTTGTAIASSSFNTVYTRSAFFNHTTAASYTGFTLIPGAAITGTVSVYGYNK
jgi:hypothetical protein